MIIYSCTVWFSNSFSSCSYIKYNTHKHVQLNSIILLSFRNSQQKLLICNFEFNFRPHTNFTCISSCQILETSKNLDHCHNRHVIKVINVSRKGVTQYMDYNNFVILVLESPFLSENANVINLARSDDLRILNDNCYFYALTASIREHRLLEVQKCK